MTSDKAGSKKPHKSRPGKEKPEQAATLAGKVVEASQPSKSVSKTTLFTIAGVAILVVSAAAVGIGMLVSSSSPEVLFSEEFCREVNQVDQNTVDFININRCSQSQCPFDATTCSDVCPFGYETSQGNIYCAVSCQCASRGLHGGDMLFQEEDLPKLMRLYGVVGKSGEDLSLFKFGSSAVLRRQTWIDKSSTDGTHTIPYVVSDGLASHTKKFIDEVFKTYEEKTCIRFRPKRASDAKYLNFILEDGCSSPLGKPRVRQDSKIHLSNRCSKFAVYHELLHAFGFVHEHSRTDRDDYLTIRFDLLPAMMKGQLGKMEEQYATDLGTGYDYASIMHYAGRAKDFDFMFRKDTGKVVLPEDISRELTELDIKEVNLLYQCDGAKPSSKEEIEVISGSEEIPGSVSESPRTSSTVGATAVKPTVRPGGGGLGTGNVGAGNPDSGSTGGLTGNVGGGTSTGTGAGNTNTGGGGGGGWTGGNTGGNTGTGAGGGTGNTGGSSVSNWINWLPWAKCKVTCGTGTRKRYRFCVRRTKTIQFVHDCPGKHFDVGPCPPKPACPSAAVNWEPWGRYGPCSASCGGGYKLRVRKCPVSGQCKPGKSSNMAACSTSPCIEAATQVAPSWQAWQPFSACTKTCGGGSRIRKRQCLRDDGKFSIKCPGIFAEAYNCNTKRCGGTTASLFSAVPRQDPAMFLSTKRLFPPICPQAPGLVWIFGFFNNDKKLDLICASQDNLKVALSSASGPPSNVTSQSFLSHCDNGHAVAADFNADGLDDLVCFNLENRKRQFVFCQDGSFPQGPAFSTSYCTLDEELLPIDADGDGRKDLLCYSFTEQRYSLAMNRYL